MGISIDDIYLNGVITSILTLIIHDNTYPTYPSGDAILAINSEHKRFSKPKPPDSTLPSSPWDTLGFRLTKTRQNSHFPTNKQKMSQSLQISHLSKKNCEKIQFYPPRFRFSQFSIPPPKTSPKKTPNASWGSSANISWLVLSKRLLELISMKRWISAKRISYVVLDEADHMLSTGWANGIQWKCWDVGMLKFCGIYGRCWWANN